MLPDTFHPCLVQGCVAIVAPRRPYCEVHRRRQTKFMRQMAKGTHRPTLRVIPKARTWPLLEEAAL
jgi:hypothetical protein